MTRPQTPFEQASYDLNKFRERRMAERRAVPRDGADRRVSSRTVEDAGQSRDDRQNGQQFDTAP